MVVLRFLADLLATAAAASPNDAGGCHVECQAMDECHGKASTQDEQFQTGTHVVFSSFCIMEQWKCVVVDCLFYLVR